jgi:hypothetical protein
MLLLGSQGRLLGLDTGPNVHIGVDNQTVGDRYKNTDASWCQHAHLSRNECRNCGHVLLPARED